MRKKIKNSLSWKVFLWVFSALILCCILIYGILLTVIPKQYQFTADRQLEENTKQLFSILETMEYEQAVKEIYNFCIQNNASATISNGNESLTFGEIGTEETNVTTDSIITVLSFTDSDTEYTLLVSSLVQTAGNISSLMLRLIPAFLAVILLLSCFSAFICSRVIVAPIAEISRISEQMASLDMTWRCNIKSEDEIGILASNLNTMAGRLQAAMNELETANSQLSEDVKKFQTLEEQRRNFFAAVSHELKTPLTILKGQLENMILGYGDYQNHEKYLPEALSAAEDMEHLIREILSISKMEHMHLQTALQDISLQTSVNDAVQALLPLAKEKNIELFQQIESDIILSVNSSLWNKALSNIIGNAVIHSPGGSQIFLSMQPTEDGCTLTVENKGAHIPESDLEHVFEPFYRTDKSRSKATGGSGLGLYIVKAILDLHDIKYALSNTEKGVIFALHLHRKSNEILMKI